MARSEGLNRLAVGVKRELQKSEIERGYIFITKDHAFLDVWGHNIKVTLNGDSLGDRKIDKFGRIFPRDAWRKRLRNSKSVSIKLRDGISGIDIQLRK